VRRELRAARGLVRRRQQGSVDAQALRAFLFALEFLEE
jgi:hypothetical protein